MWDRLQMTPGRSQPVNLEQPNSLKFLFVCVNLQTVYCDTVSLVQANKQEKTKEGNSKSTSKAAAAAERKRTKLTGEMAKWEGEEEAGRKICGPQHLTKINGRQFSRHIVLAAAAVLADFCQSAEAKEQ